MHIIPFYYIKKNNLKDEMLYAHKPIEWANTIVTTILAKGRTKNYEILLNTDDSSITNLVFKNSLLEQSNQLKSNLIIELKILNKLLFVSLIKGLLIMFGCLSIIFLIDHYTSVNYYVFVVREALYIIGWVSMWKGIELLIFDRWLIKNKLQIIDKFPNYNYNIKQHEI
jgi:hypothetical protein